MMPELTPKKLGPFLVRLPILHNRGCTEYPTDMKPHWCYIGYDKGAWFLDVERLRSKDVKNLTEHAPAKVPEIDSVDLDRRLAPQKLSVYLSANGPDYFIENKYCFVFDKDHLHCYLAYFKGDSSVEFFHEWTHSANETAGTTLAPSASFYNIVRADVPEVEAKYIKIYSAFESWRKQRSAKLLEFECYEVSSVIALTPEKYAFYQKKVEGFLINETTMQEWCQRYFLNRTLEFQTLLHVLVRSCELLKMMDSMHRPKYSGEELDEGYKLTFFDNLLTLCQTQEEVWLCYQHLATVAYIPGLPAMPRLDRFFAAHIPLERFRSLLLSSVQDASQNTVFEKLYHLGRECGTPVLELFSNEELVNMALVYRDFWQDRGRHQGAMPEQIEAWLLSNINVERKNELIKGIGVVPEEKQSLPTSTADHKSEDEETEMIDLSTFEDLLRPTCTQI